MANVEKELELKFIPTGSITREQIIKVLSKKGIVAENDGVSKRQEDTYYDDAEGSLAKSGRSFRIRRKKDGIEVTYKVPAKKANTEYKSRGEYQVLIPDGNIQDIDLKRAIECLKEKYSEKEYPEIKDLPTNMIEILTVENNRHTTNLSCSDGTIIEMAMDSLIARNAAGDRYKLLPEIEFELTRKDGDSQQLDEDGSSKQLDEVKKALTKEFSNQLRENDLSKYQRARKEMGESDLTIDEVATCVLFSQILNSTEFDKLKQKGQILHRYDKETTTNLDNFKNFDYMLKTLRSIKREDYTFAIPREIAENEQMKGLLEGVDYQVKDEITLEDMMCLLLSDVDYKVVEEVLVHFLNTNYYGIDDPTTNRFSHSQQVMLASGLLARKVNANFEDRFTSMMSALFHDIGHVPMSHTLEELLNEMDGIFSHEINGKKTVDYIYSETEAEMMERLMKEFPGLPRSFISERLEKKAIDLKEGITNHSRKGATKRTAGINNQAPRVNDKICYVASDIADLIRYAITQEKRNPGIINESWLKETTLEMCGRDENAAAKLRKDFKAQYIKYLRAGDYGRAIVNVVDSIGDPTPEEQGHYNVDYQLWKLIEKLIKRIHEVRKSLKVEQAKSEMSQVAMDYIMDKFKEEYEGNKGDIEAAWEKLLRGITRLGECDLLDILRDKLKMKVLKKLKDLEGISPEDMPPDGIAMTAREIETCAYISCIERGMTDEEAREEAKKIGKVTRKYTPQEVLAYFRKNNIRYLPRSSENSEFDFLATVDQLHEMADVQLKLKPGTDVTFEGVCEDAKMKYGEGIPSHITDQYYNVKMTRGNFTRYDVRMKVRMKDGSEKKTLIVKVPIGKKVPERTEKQFSVECPKEYTMEEMLQAFNEKFKESKLTLLEDKPYESIDIHRVTYQSFCEGYSVEVAHDTFSGTNGVLMQEFEIKCPTNPKVVSNIRKRLKKNYEKAFIEESKLRRIQGSKDKER